MKIVQTIGVVCALMLAFVSCEKQTAPAKEIAMQKAPSELIINLISDPVTDPHSSLMGLHLAQKVRKNGQDVTVFLNVHGVKLMTPGADTLVFHEENLQQVIKDLIADGGVVRACPHCMMAHEVEATDLLEGVEVMENNVMMEKIAKNPTVFTY